MAGIRQTTLILGEGITEFFFLNSLRDDYPALKNVMPSYPKHTSIEELEIEIKKAIRDYNKVFCVIDMDNKQDGVERMPEGQVSGINARGTGEMMSDVRSKS